MLIPNTAASAKKSAHAKLNAEGMLSLQKKPRSSSSSILSELGEFSFMRKEQLEEETHCKIMQLNIEEREFKAESEWEERKIGMLEQELSMKMEKLKVDT